MERSPDILIGPKTTVFTLLSAHPSLEAFLLARVPGFERLSDERARTRWARVMTLDDVALGLNVSWTRLGREIAAEVERETGRPPRVAGAPRRIVDDGRRLDELRDILARLEGGAPLDESAARWREATADLEREEEAALRSALSAEPGPAGEAAVRAVRAAAGAEAELTVSPAGHPLQLLRREAVLLRRLCAALEAELDRLGGSPTRRRWQRQKPLVARLVDRLSEIELRFRREQQAWFPALAVHDVDGPQALLAGRQLEALETLRRLRLAVERDDAGSAAEAGARFLGEAGDLLAQDERLLEPLARRHLSARDWGAVRELEDGVGWALIRRPPAWPGSPSETGG